MSNAPKRTTSKTITAKLKVAKQKPVKVVLDATQLNKAIDRLFNLLQSVTTPATKQPAKKAKAKTATSKKA